MHLTEQSINLEDAALPGASETPCRALARARSAAHAGPAGAADRRNILGVLHFAGTCSADAAQAEALPTSCRMAALKAGDERPLLPGMVEGDLFRVPFE